jgi:flavin reductase (DIM6/NTAB) family NADH-FMN oxidoreductase RutF
MDDLELELANLEPRERYLLLTSVVVPRPIALVSTLDGQGARNLAPYSFFNLCSASPPIVHFAATRARDSIANVRSTGEFVVNVVGEELAPAMHASSAQTAREEDEFELAGLQAAPSRAVGPPRVAQARVALECRLRELVQMGEGTIVFGDVVHVHVARAVWREGAVDPALLRPLARLGGDRYAAVTDAFTLAPDRSRPA